MRQTMRQTNPFSEDQILAHEEYILGLWRAGHINLAYPDSVEEEEEPVTDTRSTVRLP